MSPVVVIAIVTPLATAFGMGIALVEERGQARRQDPPIHVVNDPTSVPARIFGLPPIIANLAEPEGAFVRLEATAIAAKALHDRELITTLLRQDFVTYLRSASLASMHGSGGFQSLRDDLLELARLRSGGSVAQVAITTFIVQ